MAAYATVDRRGDRYIVTSSSRTESGFLVTNGWYRILDAGTVDPESLGTAALQALDQSAPEVPDPPRSASPFQPVLDALGLTTFNAYAKGTRSVDVARDDSGDIKITPTRSGGAREGFVEIGDEALRPTSARAGEIGAKLLAAEAMST